MWWIYTFLYKFLKNDSTELSEKRAKTTLQYEQSDLEFIKKVQDWWNNTNVLSFAFILNTLKTYFKPYKYCLKENGVKMVTFLSET